MHSIYIHIPFCKSICSYCDFCKVLYNQEWVNKYLLCLEEEIKNRYNNEVIKTLYIGGGTPSSLDIDSLQKLMDICKIFNLDEKYEFTFECNINDLEEEKLNILKNNGVNRLSIGIESFDKKKLKFMERTSNYDEVLEKINLCRNFDFNNINVDLIYGIPGENLHVLKNDLKKILTLDVEHISTYSLMIEDNTKIGIKKIKPIREELDSKMYKYIVKFLTNNGYEHYEVSNFCKPDKYSRHNLNYWQNKEYFGFGCGASGYIGNVRYTNTFSIIKYLNKEVKNKEELLSLKDVMDNEVMLGLRLIKGINLQEFFDKYEVNLQEVYNIKPLLKTKELIYKDGNVFINPKYIYVMNEILIKLI